MKKISMIAILALGVAAFAMQDAVSFARTWKVGDKDNFRIVLDANTQMGDAIIAFNSAQTVKKVFDNGDAELETLVSSMTVKFNGQEMPGQPDMPPATARVSRFGMPSAGGSGMARGMNTQFIGLVGLVPDKPTKVGETQTFAYSDPENSRRTVKGTAKLEAIEDGVGRLVTNAEVIEDGNTMKVAMTSWVTVSDSRLVKAEGALSNVSMGQMQIPAIQFKVERVR